MSQLEAEVFLVLQVKGNKTFFAGTNIFYILLRQTADDPLGFTDDGVRAYLQAQVRCHFSQALATNHMQHGVSDTPACCQVQTERRLSSASNCSGKPCQLVAIECMPAHDTALSKCHTVCHDIAAAIYSCTAMCSTACHDDAAGHADTLKLGHLHIYRP